MSLYSAFQCDNCELSAKVEHDFVPDAPADWIQVEWKEQTQQEMRLHFCSFRCLSEWSTKTSQERE